MIQSTALIQMIGNSDWDGLSLTLSRASNSEFRRLEGVMQTAVLTRVDNAQFWTAYLHLLKHRHQAFLSCILSVKHLARTEQLDFTCQEAQEVVEWLDENLPAAKPKIVRMALPLMVSPGQIEMLFRTFDFNSDEERIATLLKETTAQAYFALFRALQHVADRPQVVRNACLSVMKKSDDMSFNMASLLRSYFDISDLRSTFSLQIEPYELSYIEQSYEAFVRVLGGKRPNV